VIELNPFCEASSGALFDWENETDKSILFGRSPFQFRILEKPKEDVLDLLSPPLRIIYNLAHPNAESISKGMAKFCHHFLVTHQPTKKKVLTIFQKLTKKYQFKILTFNFTNLIEIASHINGCVHWECTEKFFYCFPGCKKLSPGAKSIDGNDAHLVTTLMVIAFYEIELPDIPDLHHLMPKAYAYVYYLMSKRGFATENEQFEALSIEMHNCLLLCKTVLEILK